MRIDGRQANSLRPIELDPGFQVYAEGSVLISQGNTRVICSVSIEEGVPPFLKGSGKGWITAEYGMLPRSTHTRNQRESVQGRPSGRTQEIQRLIGRSLRAIVDMTALGERTLKIDCDVIQADGGTRTASITGGYVALAIALKKLVENGTLKRLPLTGQVAAVSVGVVDLEPLLDLNYSEDSTASVDFNVVMTDKKEFIELQGTAERRSFSRQAMNDLLDLAEGGIERLFEIQKRVLAE